MSSTIKPKGPVGVAYLRVSHDDQSVAQQRREITDWLQRHSLTIAPEHWIADEGWSRHDDDIRPGFNRLMALVRAKKLNWIVCFNHDRFAASTPLKLMAYLHELEQAQVELFSVSEESHGNLATSDMVPLILNSVHASRTTAEVYSKAERAVEGVETHAGNPRGNLPPYAYDKVCLDPSGREKWRLVLDGHDGFETDEDGNIKKYGGKRPRPLHRPIKRRIWPDGREEVYAGYGNNPNPDDKDLLRLAPSVHTDRIQAVKLIFEMFVEQAISPFNIAKVLNRTPGIKPPPNPVPKWTDQFVRQVLLNPLYAYGVQVRFRHTHAQLAERREGRVQPVVKVPGERLPRGRRRERTEWVVPQERGEGLVSEEVWEAAYAKLKGRPVGTTTAPKNPDRWLQGLVRCGGCGAVMRSVTEKRPNGRLKCGYACNSYYLSHRKAGASCPRNFVHETDLEQVIVKYLEEAGERLDLLTQAPGEVVIAGTEKILAEGEYTAADVLPPGDLYREAAVRLDDGVRQYIKTLTAVWRDVKGKGGGYKELKAAWEQKHRGKLAQAQKRLASEEEKLDNLLSALTEMRAGIARDRLRLKIEQQEELIRGLRQEVVPLTEQLEEARATVVRCRENLQEVRAVLLADDRQSLRRRSAAAIRRVVRSLTVFYRTEEHRSPSRPRTAKPLVWSVPERVQVLPMVGNAREYGVSEGIRPQALGWTS